MNWLEAPRRALFSSLFPLAFIAALAACQPDVGATAKTTIAGFVVKGPVNAATVTAYSVNDRGRAAEALGTTKTAADGSFVVDVGGHSGPTLVCAESGTYTEEATGGLVDLGAAQLCALVDDQKLGQATNGVLITPFTSLHAGLTACLVGKGAEIDVPAASARAASRLNDFLAQKTAGFDFRTTKVFDVTSSTAPGLSADVWHGLLLAGLSESARQISLASHIDPGVRVTAATLSTALLRDIDDGACVFDGSGPDGVKLAQADVPLSSNTLRGAPQGLALGIEQFLRNPSTAA